MKKECLGEGSVLLISYSESMNDCRYRCWSMDPVLITCIHTRNIDITFLSFDPTWQAINDMPTCLWAVYAIKQIAHIKLINSLLTKFCISSARKISVTLAYDAMWGKHLQVMGSFSQNGTRFFVTPE